MRSFIVRMLTAVAFAGITAGAPAKAEDHSVCLFGGRSDSMQCGSASLEQCQATAVGGLGYCTLNPAFGSSSFALYRQTSRH